MATEQLNESFKSYVLSTIIKGIENNNPPSYKPGTAYNLGEQVVSNNKKFTCTKKGVSSNNAPDSISGIVTDGTVQWLYIGNADIHDNLYLGLGRPQGWDTTPDDVTNSQEQITEVKNDLLTLLRVTEADFRVGLKNKTWVSGTTYHNYTGNDTPTQVSDMYVINDLTDVYKCIDNNKGAESTVKPDNTSEKVDYIYLSDGYVWKYMGSILPQDLISFSTPDYVPLSTIAINENEKEIQKNASSGGLSKFDDTYNVQGTNNILTSAYEIFSKNNVTPDIQASLGVNINGSNQVDHIYVTKPGSGYERDTFVVIWDGSAVMPPTQVEASATITGGAIDTISLDTANNHQFTTGVQVVILGDGSGADVTANVDGNDVITGFTVNAGGSGYTWAKVVCVPGGLAISTKALLVPQGGHGKRMMIELNADTLLFSFLVNDLKKPYVVNGEYSQISLVSSVENKEGSTKNALGYIGPKHPNYGDEGFNTYSEGSGYILYLNNIESVDHLGGQQETIKLAINF